MMTTPDKVPSGGKRSFDEDDGRPARSLLAKIRGAEDDDIAHEATRYIWWHKHEGSTSQCDKRFATKRQAILYCAKRNSEALVVYAEEVGKVWADLFKGSYVIEPNQPFDLETFVELSDDALLEWSDAVCNAFARHKTASGTSFRYAPRAAGFVNDEELLTILKRESGAPTNEHVQRQLLLLSDIAGFD